MRKEVAIPIMLFLIGLALLVIGASAYFSKAATTAVCEACGKEVSLKEPEHLHIYWIETDDGVNRYADCPICALAIANYYKNATISTKCMFWEPIKIVVKNGNLSSATVGFPKNASDGMYNIRVIFGDNCSRRAIFCSQECVEYFNTSWSNWEKDLPVITLQEAFSRAKETKFTIAPRQIGIPTVTYAFTLVGIVSFALSPITWRVMKK